MLKMPTDFMISRPYWMMLIVIGTVVTAVMVLKHQTISTHSANYLRFGTCLIQNCLQYSVNKIGNWNNIFDKIT